MQHIGASELIITGKGTIYHLDLEPEQLAETVITVGDPDRVSDVSKYFDRIEHKAQHREFVTHTGYIGSKRLSVVSTGIGPDNIDIVLNELDALVNIDLDIRVPKVNTTSLSIIRLGTCGGLQPDISVDSLVVSEYGIGMDNLMHYYEHGNTAEELDMLAAFVAQTPFRQRDLKPYITKASSGLLQHFTQGYTKGITVTCPGFYGPQGRTLRIPIAFPALPDALAAFRHGERRITNFEMETAAIYGLGSMLGHHCLSISTIVANRASQTFTNDSAKAVDNMIRRSLEIIADIKP
jgi:uridine phosphorylase